MGELEYDRASADHAELVVSSADPHLSILEDWSIYTRISTRVSSLLHDTCSPIRADIVEPNVSSPPACGNAEANFVDDPSLR